MRYPLRWGWRGLPSDVINEAVYKLGTKTGRTNDRLHQELRFHYGEVSTLISRFVPKNSTSALVTILVIMQSHEWSRLQGSVPPCPDRRYGRAATPPRTSPRWRTRRYLVRVGGRDPNCEEAGAEEKGTKSLLEGQTT